MNWSRIILRLEVKDDCNLVDFSYSAPDLTVRGVAERQLAGHLPRHESKLLGKKADILKGQRNYYKIVIETHKLGEMEDKVEDTSKLEMDDKVEDASKLETASLNTIPTSKDDIGSKKNPLIDKRASTTTTISKLKKEKTPPIDDDKGPLNHVVRYLSGNPAVETTEGFLHLYKEKPSFVELFPGSHMLCMLSIPATFCLQDLLKYLGPVLSDLEMIKIVKPGKPNEYMALLKFRTLSCAHEFYETCNDKKFNSIEPDICHLSFVAKIDCIRSQEGAGEPISNAIELPVCAVCLEKMDESVEGVLTILCSHSFHTPCIAQCEDTTCPVCRYTLTPIPVAGNKCFQCSNQEDLWICLICGEVGCGRYANGHAHGHFQVTAHTYAMQLGSNRVWDYVGENYVHRLVLNKVDGKLIEVDNELNQAAVCQDEKIESLSLEYTYLLTTQLDSQREFFEKKMKILEEQGLNELSEVELKLKKALEECSRRDSIVSGCNKDKQVLEKRFQLLTTKMTKLQLELEEEEGMNKCLRDNQSQWQSKVASMEENILQKDNEIKDLQDQLRDIMFYLDSQEKLKTCSEVTQEELAEGRIIVQPPTAEVSKSKRNKKKK